MRLFLVTLIVTALIGILVTLNGRNESLAQVESPADQAHLLVELINAERADAGVPPLKMHANLQTAAMWLAEDMAVHDYVGHIDSEGRSTQQRINDFGYTNLRSLAENYAVGEKEALDVLALWMSNTSRQEAILDPSHREIGAGSYDDDTTTWENYWVLELGSRSDIYPVIINDEAAQTDIPEVDLYIYGEGWAEEMRLSNDGTTWTEWQPHQPTYAWRLEAGPAGERTIFLELRSAEETISASDNIEITTDAAPPPDATATPMSSPTQNTPSPTTMPSTSTPTPVDLPTSEDTATPTPTPSDTPTPTITDTAAPTATPSPTRSPTPTINPRVGQNNRILYLPLAIQALPPPPTPTATPTVMPEPQPVGTCLSPDEVQLAKLINNYRADNGLSAVPLSRSLTDVGQAHVRDLHHHRPDAQPGCNLHSWSANGPWSAVCYTADHANAEGMWNKPREISGGLYSGNGFENAYNAQGTVDPQAAYELWIGDPTHSDVILERGVWERYDWPAMGVGVYEGYAVLWFGDAADPQGTVAACP
jgi:uncharacterized protein YkwD